MTKKVKRLISAGVNVGLILLFVAVARLFPQIYPAFYTDFSRAANRFLGSVCAILPFPVWEVLLVALALWQLVSLVRSIVKKHFLDWLTRLPVILTTLAFLFVALWGLNFFGPDIGEAVSLSTGEYTESELTQVLGYYAAQANAWSAQVERDENGDVVLPDQNALSDTAVASCRLLAEEYPRFSDPVPRVKRLLGSELFGYMGVTGIYVCLTGEPSVSAAAHAPSVPFTMCHELGHSLCFSSEDEANFAGFLICSYSDDPLFRYSGYLNAYIYCYNALYRVSPQKALAFWKRLSDQVLHDLNAAHEHYQQYDGAVQEIAQSVNDAYLHSFDQEGTQSYDMVTDYLIAYYLKNAAS